jgi:hypothetical protein
MSGFRATGIWPLNREAINQYMQPSIQFVQVDLTHTDDEHNEERNNCMEEGEEGSNDHLHTREEGEEERRGVADLCFRARSATSRAILYWKF